MAKKKICLDAGHYGKFNRSPVVKEYYESDMAWKLHLLLKKHLEQYGFEVVTTRSNQATDKAVYERGKLSKGCDLFLSLHSNAADDESVDYPVVYVPLNGKGNELGEKLAKCIETTMGTAQKGKIATRKGKNGEYYGVIRGAVAVGTVGMLVEHSFHTNGKAAKWLLDESNLDKLARAEAQAIAEHFGMEAADKTEIAGLPKATIAQMQAYIKAKNPGVAQSVLGMIPLYLIEGNTEGIRGDIAFAQSCLETGNFTFEGSAVTLEQNNFCGLGVTSNGVKGNSFDTPVKGIRAQIQHLKAYANTEPLKNECADPRFKYVDRGSAPYVEWLGTRENPSGKGWASGANYGGKILDILENIIAEPIVSTPEGEEVEEMTITIHAYSKRKDGDKSLAKNFKVKEFACTDGSDPVFVAPKLVEILQKIRTHFGKPVIINSAYRTPTKNKNVGGETYSQHLYGTAADIKINGVSPATVAKYAETLLPNTGGIGIYNAFVHIDVRETKSRWIG